MNTLMTIAVCLAGSAVLQMVGFYFYSTYQKRKLLKSLAFGSFQEEIPDILNKQGGKDQSSDVKSGGKVAALHPSSKIAVSSLVQSKSKSDSLLPQLVAR